MSEVSEKQLNANKENAKLGGVKTEEGKLISSNNATKHGFFSQLVIAEDKINNKEFCEEMYSLFKPGNIYESQVLEIMLSNMLAYRRICQVESLLLKKGLDSITADSDPLVVWEPMPNYRDKFANEFMDELLKFQRYKVACTNVIMRSAKELKMGSFCNEPPLDVYNVNVHRFILRILPFGGNPVQYPQGSVYNQGCPHLYLEKI